MQVRYYKLPPISSDHVKDEDYFLLFETGLFDKENFMSYIFKDPIDTIRVTNYKDVEKAFQKIEEYAKRYYLAGYFSYELGYYFENKFFNPEPHCRYPLIHLCVFNKVITFNHKTGKFNLNPGKFFRGAIKNKDFRLSNLKLNFRRPQYLEKIKRIKDYIRQGSTYQVNFTGKYHFNFSGSAFSFYQDLKNRQSVSYGAFCKFKNEYILSLSPELYFRRDGLKIYSRPMKGTIKRGKNIAEDKERSQNLKNSAKNRAENLMIVDLIRNDLGRISKVNSVKVANLFSIEKYNTLFQMTSTVKGILRKDVTYFDIFKSIFPGGSVTGAPKIRTMRIIKELESQPRNIYCGALGIIFPKDKAVFNLPIRTVSLLNNKPRKNPFGIIRGKGEMGVGGGIVYDSRPKDEYQECSLKAKFLTDRYKPFELLETMLWDTKYKFLSAHLKRMRDSAEYFYFYFDQRNITGALEKLAKRLKPKFKYKIRILSNKEGNFSIESSKITLEKSAKDKYIAISRYQIDPERAFWYHKTTNRALYDTEYSYYSKKGYFDVIFLNNRGEITEGAISNIIIKKKRKYYTPPISSGLLPGIFRDYLLKENKLKEKIIYLKDLLTADKIFLCNSVRGLSQVKIK